MSDPNDVATLLAEQWKEHEGPLVERLQAELGMERDEVLMYLTLNAINVMRAGLIAAHEEGEEDRERYRRMIERVEHELDDGEEWKP